MAQANFTVAPLTGFVFATEFKINNLTQGSVKEYIWDFSAKQLVYNIKDPSYIFNTPGTKTITLSVIDFDNNISTFSQNVSVDYLYRDFITFTQIPESFSIPGKPTNKPFQISVISKNINSPLVVDLFATNSISTPYQFIPNKWNFLTPTWKFLDRSLTPVTTLSVDSVPVFKDNKIVAVSGTSEFYYVDSNTTGYPLLSAPILITATLQTSSFTNTNDSSVFSYPSFANNESVSVGLLWLVNDYYPNLLKVTSNYFDNINTLQWSGIKIPVLITCHSNPDILLPGSQDVISEVLFSYPETNTLGEISPVQLSLSGLQPNEYVVDEAPLYFQTTNKNGYRTGGYIFTTITPLTSINKTAIVANTNIRNNVQQSEAFPYPKGYEVPPGVWISNPLKNTLNKITLVPYLSNNTTINFYKENHLLLDGLIKEIPVPSSNTTNTFNYTMSGFSGIFSVAIDPRKHDVIACDTEIDCIYRLDNTGNILKTFYLSSLGDFNPYQKFFNYWTWLAPSPNLSSSRYAFYGPEVISSDPLNYLVLGNNKILTPLEYEIDVYERTVRTLTEDYFSENTQIETYQLLSPTLSAEINDLYFWIFDVTTPTNIFTLNNTPVLDNINIQPPAFINSNSASYIVVVNGEIQTPNTYIINSNSRTIIFSNALPFGSKLYILYIPAFIDSKSWNLNFTTPNYTELPVSQLLNFNTLDPYIGLMVIINNSILPTNAYIYDFETKTIKFKTPLPLNTSITIIQHSVDKMVYTPMAYTPTYVSLDKNYNIWVTLFNTVSVLKFDENLNFLFSVVPENIDWQPRAWTNQPTDLGYQSSRFKNISRYFEEEDADVYDLDPFTDEFFLKPPVVETDKDSNCWVTYANPLCCLLVKYSENGSILSQIEMPTYSMPINLAVDKNNNLWVANFHGSTYTYTALSGSLQLYDTNTSTLIRTVTGINRPGLLSIDRDNNLWFTYSLRNIGYYNTTYNILSTWTLDPIKGLIPNRSLLNLPLSVLEKFESDENRENEELTGLAIDIYNRLWIIDNTANKAWVLSASPNFANAPIPVRQFAIRPNSTLGYYVDLKDAYTFTEEYNVYRSAQATGDWTGNRWYQKYITLNSLSSIPLTATSNTFTIDDFVNRNNIVKVNESFNLSQYLKSLALPENLQSNVTLFDRFLSAAVGDGTFNSKFEDLGQVIYEKIANFVQNHSDVDTCNIPQLLSLGEKINVEGLDYATEYPIEIQNLLNLGSINRSKLWGSKNDLPPLAESFGRLYNTQTDLLTANTKIILRNRFDNKFTLTIVPILSTTNIYPISSLNIPGFATPIIENYLVYEYNPSTFNDVIENIIDWSAPKTTISRSISTINDWLGNGKALENSFRYLLTENLFYK